MSYIPPTTNLVPALRPILTCLISFSLSISCVVRKCVAGRRADDEGSDCGRAGGDSRHDWSGQVEPSHHSSAGEGITRVVCMYLVFICDIRLLRLIHVFSIHSRYVARVGAWFSFGGNLTQY